MPKDEKPNQTEQTKGLLDTFEPGGPLGPIEDRHEYERRINSLPVEEKELAQESTRFADLCQYFSQRKMDIPPQILEQVGRLSSLAIAGRIRAMKDINRALMEYLNDVDQGPGIRQ
jgi:hypothetical protein